MKNKQLSKSYLLSMFLLSSMWFAIGCQQQEELPMAEDDNQSEKVDQLSSELVPFEADTRNFNVIASFNEVKGEIGESFLNEYDGKVLTLKNLSDYDPQNAGYIHFDVDKLKMDQEVFDQIRDWAEKNDACLIFESGSKNHSLMKNFYVNLFAADSDIDFDVKGLIIENTNKSEVTRTTLVSDQMSLSTQNVVPTFFNKQKTESRTMALSPVNPTTVKTYPDKKTSCMRGKCTTTWGTPLYTITNGFRGVPANSSSYTYRASNVKYSNMNSNINQWGIQDREVIKWGAITNDALLYDGTYACGQTASYTQSESYSKSWSVGIKLDAKTEKIGSTLAKFIKELTFGASGSIGGSKSEGTGYGTSIRMTKRFARTAVYSSRWRANLGYWRGTVTYDLQRRPTSGPRPSWRTYEKVKSTFNTLAHDNDWDGNQPYAPNNNNQTQILFGWHTWGTSIPNCSARQESDITINDHIAWWN